MNAMADRPTVDIVVPVYNEEKALPRSILILTEFLRDHLKNPWQVIIADRARNGRPVSRSLHYSAKKSPTRRQKRAFCSICVQWPQRPKT